MRSYNERVQKLQSIIKKNVSRGGKVGTSSAPTNLSTTLLGIDSLNIVESGHIHGSPNI